VKRRPLRWRIELTPSAARSFRRLPRPAQQTIAERLAQLEETGPPVAGPEERSGGEVVPVGAGSWVLLCVERPAEVLLVAAIESVDESLAAIAGRIARPAVERALGGAGGERDDVVWLRPRRGPLPSVHRKPSPPGLMDLLIGMRRALRTLARQPGLSLLAVVALALGIGLPTAMFSFIDAAFLRGLPVEDPAEVIHLERRPIGAGGEGWGAYAQDYEAWREQQRSFAVFSAFTGGTVTLRSESVADRWSAGSVTPEVFAIMGASAALGRVLRPEDAAPSAPPVVVVGHDLWRDRLASDPRAVGRMVWVDGVARTVVGVMPPEFRFPNDTDVWLPLALAATGAPSSGDATYQVMGRLRDGVSRDEARAEFQIIAARMAERFPDTHEGYGITVKPITERFMGETPVRTMYIMLGAVLLVLVVACANVANLLLVRAVHRIRDLAVRAALGASRGRLVRQLLLEAGLLALAGGAAATVIAAAGIRGLSLLLGDRMPYWVELRLDGSALLFALLLSVAAAMLAGVLPALKATSRDLAATLHDESRGSTGIRIGRIMHGLVVLEIALSLGLLVVTGLMLLSVRRVQNVSLGFTTENVLTARLTLPDSYDSDARGRFYDALLSSLEAEPRAAAVALASGLPATRLPTTRFVLEGAELPDDESQLPRARNAVVSDDFFATFGVAPLQGRVFRPEDTRDGLPVAIVSRRFVQQHFDGAIPIGRRIRLGGAQASDPWRTIVGVVPDLWLAAFDAPGTDRNPAGIYVPITQNAPASASIAIHARGDANPLAASVRAAAFALDRDVALYELRTMDRLIADNSWFYGLGAAIMAACGATALLLASIGLYGVIAFSVGRRTREIGIRMAMGARPSNILSLVLRRGVLQIAAGTLLGFGLALLLGRGVATLLFQVSPTDPLMFFGVAAMLAAIGIGAMLVPARRAARLDPLVALRNE
jgi:predicted permease